MKVLTYLRPFINSMFTDSMDVYRHTDTEDEYGAESIDIPQTPTYKNVRCRLSWSEEESPRNYNSDFTPVELPIKIFCDRSTDVVAGDHVVVRRMSGDEVLHTYKGICADSAVYESHRELYFRVKEWA